MERKKLESSGEYKVKLNFKDEVTRHKARLVAKGFKELYCSKEGFKSNEFGEVTYERANTRTNCKAMVRFNVSKEGVWKITKFVLDLSYELIQGKRFVDITISM
jgi:tartrate dehydratase alpha subunit/fumarate hydratase class I-like protein